MRNYEEHTMLYNYLINFYIMFVLQFSETRQSVKIESLNIKSALNSLIYRGEFNKKDFASNICNINLEFNELNLNPHLFFIRK